MGTGYTLVGADFLQLFCNPDGRRQDKPPHMLRLAGVRKRQGTKSRWVGHPALQRSSTRI